MSQNFEHSHQKVVQFIHTITKRNSINIIPQLDRFTVKTSILVETYYHNINILKDLLKIENIHEENFIKKVVDEPKNNGITMLRLLIQLVVTIRKYWIATEFQN